MPTPRKQKKIRGVIVWDFDRVLFDTERFYRGVEPIFENYGVSPQKLLETVVRLRNTNIPISLAPVFSVLRKQKILVPEKKIRKEVHQHLLRTPYFTRDADTILRRFRKNGFHLFIISASSSANLRKKIYVGCGEKFARHFIKIFASRKPKHLLIKKILRAYPSAPAFFIDDTKENIDTVKRHLPAVMPLHYTRDWSLKEVEQKILTYQPKHAKAKK